MLLSRVQRFSALLPQLNQSVSSSSSALDTCITELTDSACSVSNDWMENPSKLAKLIWRSAKQNVRDDKLWSKLTKRAFLMTPHMSGEELTSVLFSYGKIRYRDMKFLEETNSLVLKHLSDLPNDCIVTILNSYKQLEYRRLDTIQLLVNQLIVNQKSLTAHDLALAANAASWFYIYQSEFWRMICEGVVKGKASDFTPLGVSLTVAALARVDQRHTKSLRVLSFIFVDFCRKSILPQESLAVGLHAFAKLGWNIESSLKNRRSSVDISVSSSEAILGAVEEKLIRAFDLRGPHRTGGRSNDTFDVQALVLVLHAICSLYPEGRPIENLRRKVVFMIFQLLAEVWDEGLKRQKKSLAPERILSAFQLKKIRQAAVIYNSWGDERLTISGQLATNITAFLDFLRAPLSSDFSEFSRFNARWTMEIFRILKSEIKCRPIRCASPEDMQRQEISIPKPADKGPGVVVECIGPYGYYAESEILTASEKLRQRLIRLGGRRVMEIPFFEWRNLPENEKILYLYTKARELVNQEIPESAPIPEKNKISSNGVIESEDWIDV